MPLQIRKSVKQMFAEAMSEIETLKVEQAQALHGREDVTFIDLRDPREIWRDGGIPGALNVTRGMLEFWIDPGSPYHKAFFASGNRFVFFCAGGVRSALAAKTAQDMGLTPVCHVGGGFGAWKQAGAPTETVEPDPVRAAKAAG
jgi:rhodanese-related sulfurtransferase